MKKYLIKIVLFFVAVAIVDVLFGIACQYMNDHSKGGGIKSRHYVCKESNEDVLIFGSSRAKHHYVPDIIEDSLGMTCYNTGEDGNGIILCYGFLKMITQRYSPKLIIYDVTSYDMYEDDNVKYLDLMKPFYNEPGIDTIFWTVEPKTRYMMLSNLYRYNTTCLRVLGNFIQPMWNYPKGYDALYKTMDYEPMNNKEALRTVDTLKISYFDKFIRLTQSYGIELICCVSPNYKDPYGEVFYKPIKSLCEEYNVPFLYYSAEPEISCDNTYFQDVTHLNDKGARCFTKRLGNEIKIKQYINTQIQNNERH